MLAALALGSNLHSAFGSPTENLREALRRLGALGTVTAVSSFHETTPVGLLEQPRFLNAAATLETAMDPLDLLRALLAVEASMGRTRRADQPPKGPRIIDLDLLLFQEAPGRSLILTDPELILPHPAMSQRLFVLDPLAEIAPSMRDPVSGCTVQELQERLRLSAS